MLQTILILSVGQCQVWSWASEILPDHVLQLLQGGWLNVQFPVQVLAHFLLHLVYLPQLEHSLPDYAPGLV